MENKYHLSCYNIFSHIPEKNSIACINLLKRTYSELDPSDLLKLYDSQKINSNDSELKNFISQGIICDYNEKEYIKSKFILDYENKNNTVKITISPTLACNFNCPYCFEDHSDKNTMTLEMQDKVINFIKNILIFSNKKHLRIFWFGGEPLYNQKAINSICNILNENNIDFTSKMATNGFLFSNCNIDKACNVWHLKHVQITIDGTETEYNRIKNYKCSNSINPFKKVLKNIDLLTSKGIQVVIRLNIELKNVVDQINLVNDVLIKRFANNKNVSIYSHLLME